MKMKIRICILLALVLTLTAFMSGCADEATANQIKEDTVKMVDAIIARDRAAMGEVMRNAPTTSEELDEFMEYIAPFFEDMGEYKLIQTGWHSNFSTSGTTYTMKYQITSEDGEKIYQITATAQKGTEGLVGFRVE